MKTKKELGQHWLHDSDSLNAMADLANVQADDFILEIGPGLGTLTKVLLARGAKVTAVEFDKELYERLAREATDKLTVIHHDILKFDLTQLPADYRVVANIPYYLTSNLVRVLAESSNPPQSVTMLIQKEVAERIAAKPGDMSLLSVTAQMYFQPSLGRVVPAALFTPPPKIDSQIIHLERRSVPIFASHDPKHVFRIVKAGFSNRRKTLLNSYSAGMQLSKDEARSRLESVNINPQARPQELTLEEWIRLSTL